MPIPGDLRALDARTRLGGLSIGIEAETQLSDLQAIVRRSKLKKRDARLDILVLVVSDTVDNRRVLDGHGESIRTLLSPRGAGGPGGVPSRSGASRRRHRRALGLSGPPSTSGGYRSTTGAAGRAHRASTP